MGRTSIMAIAGGTFSSIGGGKFSNGAFGGAMTHLFNAEMKSSILKNSLSKDEIIARDKTGRANYMSNKLANISDYMNTHHAGDGSSLKTFWGILLLPLALPRGVLFAQTAVISYPIETTAVTLGVAGGYPSAMSGIPSALGTSAGRVGFGVGQIIRGVSE